MGSARRRRPKGALAMRGAPYIHYMASHHITLRYVILCDIGCIGYRGYIGYMRYTRYLRYLRYTRARRAGRAFWGLSAHAHVQLHSDPRQGVRMRTRTQSAHACVQCLHACRHTNTQSYNHAVMFTYAPIHMHACTQGVLRMLPRTSEHNARAISEPSVTDLSCAWHKAITNHRNQC